MLLMGFKRILIKFRFELHYYCACFCKLNIFKEKCTKMQFKSKWSKSDRLSYNFIGIGLMKSFFSGELDAVVDASRSFRCDTAAKKQPSLDTSSSSRAHSYKRNRTAAHPISPLALNSLSPGKAPPPNASSPPKPLPAPVIVVEPPPGNSAQLYKSRRPSLSCHNISSAGPPIAAGEAKANNNNNNNGKEMSGQICIQLQSGLARETIALDAHEASLRQLRQEAVKFVAKHVSRIGVSLKQTGPPNWKLSFFIKEVK